MSEQFAPARFRDLSFAQLLAAKDLGLLTEKPTVSLGAVAYVRIGGEDLTGCLALVDLGGAVDLPTDRAVLACLRRLDPCRHWPVQTSRSSLLSGQRFRKSSQKPSFVTDVSAPSLLPPQAALATAHASTSHLIAFVMRDLPREVNEIALGTNDPRVQRIARLTDRQTVRHERLALRAALRIDSRHVQLLDLALGLFEQRASENSVVNCSSGVFQHERGCVARAKPAGSAAWGGSARPEGQWSSGAAHRGERAGSHVERSYRRGVVARLAAVGVGSKRVLDLRARIQAPVQLPNTQRARSPQSPSSQHAGSGSAGRHTPSRHSLPDGQSRAASQRLPTDAAVAGWQLRRATPHCSS